MNRKDRRAARSKRSGSGPQQGLAPGALSANLFTAAVEHFNAGRLDDAERLCRDVLMFNRGHFDALHMLAVIATRVGNLVAAAELYGRALAVDGRNAECHFNLAQVLRAQGRDHDAIAHLGDTIAFKGDHLAAHLSLAELLTRQNDLDAARARYEEIIRIDPRLVDAHHGVANILRQQGRFDESADRFRQLLALKPDFAEAHNNFGVVLAAQGRWAEAAEEYQRALALKPELVDAHRNLARALLTDGQADAALAAVMRGLARQETDEGKAMFVECAQGLGGPPPDPQFRALLARALTEGWGRSADLSSLAATMFGASEAGQAAMSRFLSGEVPSRDDLVGPHGFSSLAGDPLLRALLQSAPVRNVPLERLLTALRSGLLRLVAQSELDMVPADEVLAFGCLLAQQCFINEYVFAESETDAAQAAILRERISGARTAGVPVPPIWLAAVACFRPLHGLADASALSAQPWPAALQAVLVQQVHEPASERDLAAGMPVLTTITDEVSLKVRGQYEEMPYPRWIKTPFVGAPTTIDWYLRSQFPAAAIQPHQSGESLAVLVAGCGTGQHAIVTAQRYAGAHVLAVDLSRASLGYAARKTREAGLRNIQYAQADILNLASLNARFDLIEASGVLHHLANPAQGWRALISLLQHGGFMHIGLYSEMARADIRVARGFLADRGYRGTADDIRRSRQELLGFEDGSPLNNVAGYSDFYTTGECRDLLFHVQEHQFGIPRIKDFLLENRLTFLGFSGPVAQAYRRRFPDDAAMTDLDRWHVFETENPFAFVNMYQFWVQKTVA